LSGSRIVNFDKISLNHALAETQQAIPCYACRNTSLRFAPSPEIMERSVEAFGKARIIRAFITLDEFWDYRDNTYHPNYRIGYNRYRENDLIHKYDRHRSRESQVLFQDYLKAVSQSTDEVLLCFRRYEHEVKGGLISTRQYEKVLREAITLVAQQIPNLRYIEVCNEWRNNHFGGLSEEQYHLLFRLSRSLIDELNNEQLTKVPLLLGGPSVDTSQYSGVNIFLKGNESAAPMSPYVDFISYHDYSCGKEPVLIRQKLQQVRAWMREAGLKDQTPIFLTECGTAEGKEGGNRQMASGVIALLDEASLSNTGADVFPWCIYHDPGVQMWSTQILPDGSLSAYGAALSLLNRHSGKRLAINSPGLRSNGTGLRAIVSYDKAADSVLFQLINYDDESAEVSIPLSDLSEMSGVEAKIEEIRMVVDEKEIAGYLAPVGKLTSRSASVSNKTLQARIEPFETMAWKIAARF